MNIGNGENGEKRLAFFISLALVEVTYLAASGMMYISNYDDSDQAFHFLISE